MLFSVINNLANSMERMKNCGTDQGPYICFWKLVERVLSGSKHTTKVFVILTVLKSSTVTERFRFCFAIRPHLKAYKDALGANVTTCHMETLMGQRELSVWWRRGLVRGFCLRLPLSRTNESGLTRLYTHNWGQNTYYYFPFIARPSPMVSFHFQLLVF